MAKPRSRKCFVKGMRHSKKWGCKMPCKSPARRNSRGGCSVPKRRVKKSRSRSRR